MAKAGKKTVRRKRVQRKNIEKGQAHIQSTFNNTLVNYQIGRASCRERV